MGQKIQWLPGPESTQTQSMKISQNNAFFVVALVIYVPAMNGAIVGYFWILFSMFYGPKHHKIASIFQRSMLQMILNLSYPLIHSVQLCFQIIFRVTTQSFPFVVPFVLHGKGTLPIRLFNSKELKHAGQAEAVVKGSSLGRRWCVD